LCTAQPRTFLGGLGGLSRPIGLSSQEKEGLSGLCRRGGFGRVNHRLQQVLVGGGDPLFGGSLIVLDGRGRLLLFHFRKGNNPTLYTTGGQHQAKQGGEKYSHEAGQLQEPAGRTQGRLVPPRRRHHHAPGQMNRATPRRTYGRLVPRRSHQKVRSGSHHGQSHRKQRTRGAARSESGGATILSESFRRVSRIRSPVSRCLILKYQPSCKVMAWFVPKGLDATKKMDRHDRFAPLVISPFPPPHKHNVPDSKEADLWGALQAGSQGDVGRICRALVFDDCPCLKTDVPGTHSRTETLSETGRAELRALQLCARLYGCVLVARLLQCRLDVRLSR
jgi:hypothetical protein